MGSMQQFHHGSSVAKIGTLLMREQLLLSRSGQLT
jgi:hypothetical protein